MTTPAPRFSFEIHARDGKARTGKIRMMRGDIRTPAFMPVGTAATVKAMKPETVRATGADILLGNTYHLMLRPGAERMARLGGLHKFMNWPGPILTDSGGFQVMSLAKLRKLDADGVTFQSHHDGSRHRLTPESSMEIQRLLDADITMAFDECTPFPATPEQAADSMRLSMRWALRSKEAAQKTEGLIKESVRQAGEGEAVSREVSARLSEIAGVNSKELADQIFNSGSVILANPPAKIVRSDHKVYEEEEARENK
jgi:queuine tRNA-ribosyltransferase